MAIREFSDREGTLWRVWRVLPAFAERRRKEAFPKPEVARERRKRNEARADLPAEFACGWLTFESALEKRRVAPIPKGWDTLSDSALEKLLQGAESAGPPSRRLIE